MSAGMRSGPLVEGEWVRLTDPKGRKHNLKLQAGAQFSTKKGQLNHDDMIGHPEGIVIESSMGASYQVFRPLLFEYVVSMPRGQRSSTPRTPRRSSRWPTSIPARASSRPAPAREA